MVPYDVMSRNDKRLHELEDAAAAMAQGSLSQSNRQCGDPTCACAHDSTSRHGLNRCRYKGMPRIQRWLGLGALGAILINIGHGLAPSSDSTNPCILLRGTPTSSAFSRIYPTDHSPTVPRNYPRSAFRCSQLD